MTEPMPQEIDIPDGSEGIPQDPDWHPVTMPEAA
jgi:hypothetical protein